jgi:SAM-dependent methyltransferase
VQTASGLPSGKALDLACGTGRNTLWLAAQGWEVTAVDGSPAAIEIVRRQSPASVHTCVADLERGEYPIEPATWDLIAMCYYLQRDLFQPAKEGLVPGGTLIVIVHIAAAGEEPTRHRLLPGELAHAFQDCEILHYYEGRPQDESHRRAVAEIVARKW